jgi:cardiolipin synthase
VGSVARPDWLTVPNLLTLSRLALVPVFLILQLRGYPGLALACFGLAGVTDWFDGFLARVLHQESKLGALLDPVADKALVVAALAGLVAQGRVPFWILGLVLLRDGYMMLLAGSVRWRHLRVTVHPSRVGKYAAASLTLLVLLSLIRGATGENAKLHAYTQVLGVLAGLALVVSGVQYVFRFGHLLTARPRELS